MNDLNTKIYPYILDAIDADGYDVTPTTEAEKLAFLRDTFLSEKGWHIERVGKYKAFEEWLQGLPSAFNIDFENYRILELAKEWGSYPTKPTRRGQESAEQKLLDNWWNLVTVKTFQLFRRHKIDV